MILSSDNILSKICSVDENVERIKSLGIDNELF